MASNAKPRRTRLVSTLSEDETYGRFVHQASLDAGNAAKTNLAATGTANLAPTSTRPSVSISEGLWLEILDEQGTSSGAMHTELGTPNRLYYERRMEDDSNKEQRDTSQSCMPMRSRHLSPTTSQAKSSDPSTALSPSSNSAPMQLMAYDKSPSMQRHYQALAASPKGYKEDAVQARGQSLPIKPRIRRVSSILNSFTCDLVATDIMYEVPLPQPSKLERLQDWASEAISNVRTCSSSCCSRNDVYDVAGDPESQNHQSSDHSDGERSNPGTATIGGISEGGKWRKILNKISIEALPGKMIAILGGSGSGKTSFLDVLSGRSPPECRVSGKLTINGAEVHRSSEELKFCVGYVTQSIFLLPNLTVYETLRFVALLRLPKSLSYQEKLNRVTEVLSFLNLAPLSDRLVGGEESKGLSGGQQRLVAIATQMIYNPGVLLLDEPTSGLDSYTAEHVCKTLNDLAMRRSRSILLTIHQPGPEITRLFDHVLILSNGHTIFNGPADLLVRYFNSLGYALPEFTNPCDYYVDLATLDTRSAVREKHSRNCFDFLVNAQRDFADELWKLDDESDNEDNMEDSNLPNSLNGWTPSVTPMQATQPQLTSFASRKLIHQRRSMFMSSASIMKLPPQPPQSINSFKKFGVLLRRTVRNEFRDFSELGVQLFQAVLLSLLFGLVFVGLALETTDLQNRKAVLFIAFTLYPFMAVFETIAKYAGQQMMTFHEMVNGLYTSTPFGTAKILGELPGSLLLSTAYSIPLYFISSLRLDVAAYFKFLLLLSLLLQVSRMMALSAAVVSQSPNYAALTANLIYTGWILTAGYIININNLWKGVQWISFISPIRYAFQGAAITELSGVTFTSNCTETVGENKTCATVLSGDADLKDLAFDELGFGECVAIMCGMYVAMVSIVLIGLHVRRNSRPE